MTRHPLILAALGAALVLGACGGDTADPASSREDTAFEGALKFAKCMREHGIDVPDPKRDGNGRISIQVKGKRGAQGSQAAMEAAQKACDRYMHTGGGSPPDAATRAKMQDAALAYARCMRRHGVDVPDPTFTKNGGVVTRMRDRGKGGVSPDSPVFKKADEACHDLLADARRQIERGDAK